MTELRLTDTDGYTVPGTATEVTDDTADTVRAYLLNEVAPEHAAEWADFGYDPRSYRIT
ncbi:hypothetical protein [Streptomyces kaempferi]|uniref:Uncharacterized protein n=1 Tax=Streptomyces kaempferi TaxID=333725 RepID=A0ABW3XIX8_9ACTN